MESGGFDGKDRALVTVESETTEDGRTRTTRRGNVSYDGSGRMTHYEEELAAEGGGSPRATGRQEWTALGYDGKGDLKGYELTTTNVLGEKSTQRHETGYDHRGRVAETTDMYTDALGTVQKVEWKAEGFDSWDRASAYKETTTGGGAWRERRWSGQLDGRGLAVESSEETRDGTGLVVRTDLAGARYDERGRVTDSVETVARSDRPEMKSVTTLAGRTYDMQNQATGGTATTRIMGRTGAGDVDLTVVEGTEAVAEESGRATKIRTTGETMGTLGGLAVHTKETVDVTSRQNGERTETRRSEGYDAVGTLVKAGETKTERANVVVDVSGRGIAYRETTVDAATPGAKTVTERQNRYQGNGELAGTTEDVTDAQGVRTHVETSGMNYNAAGQLVGSEETMTRPGLTMVTEVTKKSGMRYDELGRAAGHHEQITTMGPGLYSEEEGDRTTSYDGAGRTARTASEGVRNGGSYSLVTENSDFDAAGRATAYRSRSEGTAGISDLNITKVGYDEMGRAFKRHEEGYNNGSYTNAEVKVGYDAQGREKETTREGYNDQGTFKERTETAGYNSLGQAVGRTTKGWNASEGEFETTDTKLTYGLTGELESFDRTKATAEKKTTSRWMTKGTDSRGRSLGFEEEGQVFEGGKFVNDFKTTHDALAQNENGQETEYRQTTTKTYATGATETTTSNWKNGEYDERGRLSGFQADDTTTYVKDGETKTSKVSRRREGISYYDGDGEGHQKGLMAGYDETSLESATGEKGKKVAVRNMRYDKAGRFVEGETTAGETNRVKDTLRRISDILSGGNIAGAGRNLWEGLVQLVTNTAGLGAAVGTWIKENVADPAKGFVENMTGWLESLVGSDAQIVPQLDARTLANLVRAIEEKAGGAQMGDIPLNLQSAAVAVGVFDQGLSVTKSKDKAFDAQGRAVSWVEISRSAAAPEKEVESLVTVSFEGTSTRLASYAARTADGGKVTNLYRDNFAYDDFGRSTYREVTFNGEDISILNEGDNGAPSQRAGDGADLTAPTVSAGWAQLTADQRTQLMDNVLAEKVEVLGQVDFTILDGADFDANGIMENRIGRYEVRGVALNRFEEATLFDRPLDEMKADLLASIDTEAAREMALIQAEKDLAGMNLAAATTNLETAQGEFEKANKEQEDAKNNLDSANKDIETLPKEIEELTKEIQGYVGKILVNDDSQKQSGLTEYRTVWFDGAGTIIFKKERGGRIINYFSIGILNNDSGQDVVGAIAGQGRLTAEGERFIGLLNQRIDLEDKLTKANANFDDANRLLDGDYDPLTQKGEKGLIETVKEKEGTCALAENFFKTAREAFDGAEARFKEMESSLPTSTADKKKEALSTLAGMVADFTTKLAEQALQIGRSDYRLDAKQLEGLLNGGTVRLGERDYGLKELGKVAMVKQTLKKSESLAGFGLNRPDEAVNLSWGGSLRLHGRPVTLKDGGGGSNGLENGGKKPGPSFPRALPCFPDFPLTAMGNSPFPGPSSRPRTSPGGLYRTSMKPSPSPAKEGKPRPPARSKQARKWFTIHAETWWVLIVRRFKTGKTL
ncbi:MAG: hypothetical protein IPP35_04010 [Elusimicrobia bacterium]|nr:hypothetical protein [Elusimicrobiota bacterium]